MKKISIITPCLNEKENLIDCCEQVKKIFSSKLKDFDYEHIIVDNNSKVETIVILKKLCSEDKKIKAVINNKNYGAARSCFNAIKYCTGDAVIPFLPSDLQDPPDLVFDFVKKWMEGYDFVIGVRKKRQEFFVMRWVRNIFYKTIVIISGKKIYNGISDYQIIDKKIINEMILSDNFLPFTRILAFNYSDNYASIDYEWKKRVKGKSNDGLIVYLGTAINSLLYVTSTPFRALLYLGFILSICSILYIINTIYKYITIGSQAMPGITLIIILILILSSFNFLIFGFLGEYLVSIFNIISKNQKILIREKINF
jgi:glycosyltransferase involved in cell wall biosynthesis